MKLTLKIAALLVASCGFASAASSITASCPLDMDFTTNASSLTNELTSTFVAKIGWYDGTALTTASAFADINAHWTAVGQAAFSTGSMAGFDGYFNAPGLTYADTLGLAGKNVWLWVTNGAGDNLVMQATSATAGAGYKFHLSTDIPNTGAVQVDVAHKAGWTLALGTVTTGGANSANGGSYVLNVVPEPSAALLGAFGALALLRRRRA